MKPVLSSLDSLLALGSSLTPTDWDAPTDCPLWRVADIYAHINGVEEWMAAGSTVAHGNFQDFIDSHVAARHDNSPADLLAELRDLVVVRREQLTSSDDSQTVFIPVLNAPGPLSRALQLRAFDLWTHEQDIRHAVGQPGNLAAPSAWIVRDMLVAGLPRVVARVAGVPAGTTVRFTVVGDVPLDLFVQVDESGRGHLGACGDADVHLTMGWDAFARLSAGRGSVADHQVWISGDPAVAARILNSLNVAP